jgi:hypothetical protein
MVAFAAVTGLVPVIVLTCVFPPEGDIFPPDGETFPPFVATVEGFNDPKALGLAGLLS